MSPSQSNRRTDAATPTADALRPLMIRASAGTGKTYQLTGRLLQILLNGAAPETILATTFTRKAAGEILNRLLLSLARAATDPKALDGLRTQIGDPNLTADAPAPLLLGILQSIHRLRICTLDSLFSQLARSFSFELRLPPGWQLTDEIEESWFVDLAITRMLEQFDETEVQSLFHMLSKGQAERNVAMRLQQVVQNNYAGFRRSHRDAWRTLTPVKAPPTKAITAAVGVLDSSASGDKRIDKAMRKYGEWTLTGQWDAIVEAKLIAAADESQHSGDPVTYYKKPVPDDLVAAMQVIYAKARHEFVMRLKMQTEATGDLLESYDRNLGSLKQNARRFSFDDVSHQLAAWIDRLQANQVSGDLDRLAIRMDASLDHVLLDEFQDTAPVQWDVLRPFARRASVGAPERTFFCVGDTKQAIYGWRGGEAKIFDAVQQELPNVDSQPQDTSFRSSPVITDNVTKIFKNLHRHPAYSEREPHPVGDEQWKCHALHEFEDAFHDHHAAFRDRPGYVQFSTGPQGEGSASEKRALHERYVATQVRELADKIPGKSIGILTRTNQTVGRMIYLLRELGLDVSQEGGNPLIDSAAVELVLSAIRIAEHPGDLRWRFHLANSPLAKSLELTSAIDRKIAYRESLRLSSELRDRLEHEGLVATVTELAKTLLPECGEADRLRLRQLIGLANQYARAPQSRWSAFVEMVTKRRVQRPREAQIRVMTIHQAKGLEFDAVILPELDGPLSKPPQKCVTIAPSPTARATGALRYVKHQAWGMLEDQWQQAFGRSIAAAMTESLCTLYVAVTRPVHALYIYIIPAGKSNFNAKTSAALLYHALGVTATVEPETDLYIDGDREWFNALPAPQETPSAEPKPEKSNAGETEISVERRPQTKPTVPSNDSPRRSVEDPKQMDLF
ncbi:Putative ATP-dependent DNA helicase YjcD [Rosistilla carotiformis]|uniref:DNA 3'-5' helicase n=1 Tax=Rosistilla carotiformis TaxID=2528017 RepID=A0A518JV06_9BACT|nr:UvrD-helicase domain-containing protein [Rosistilla carotiformis]QDV69358.1 Putative ATP-dependent DNA helicase YjcD [Rosistilla carotiformis]